MAEIIDLTQVSGSDEEVRVVLKDQVDPWLGDHAEDTRPQLPDLLLARH
jgi:hypothetical protein